MKKNTLMVLSLSLLSIFAISAKDHHLSKKSCATKQSCADLNSNCQCFCAVKGDYRHKLPKQDHPIFYKKGDPKDKFHKGCYCAARDIKILEAQAKGMPRYEAIEKYKNYNSPSEKIKIGAKKLKKNL